MDVLVGTSDGLYRVDGDVTRLSNGGIRAMSGQWAIVDADEVMSLAGGPRVPLPARPNCVVSHGDGALIGTAEARLFRVAADGSVERDDTFDTIPTRGDWYTPWGAPPDTRSLAVTADAVPLVNVHVGGVWRGNGVDGQWTEVVDVDNDTHQVVASSSDARLVVAAAAVGFGRSVDGGQTFEWTADGLHASYCRAVAIAGDHVLVTASTGPSTNRGAVYRRPVDSSEPFVRCTDWFQYNIDTFQLAAAGDLAVVGTKGGDVYLSADAGATWEAVARSLPSIRCVVLQDPVTGR